MLLIVPYRPGALESDVLDVVKSSCQECGGSRAVVKPKVIPSSVTYLGERVT